MLKRFAALGFTVALALAGVVALLWLLGGSTPSAHADSPHYVAPDCTGLPAPCHTTIQEAVDAAVPGDEIRVASGDYAGVQGRPAPAGYLGPTVITQVVYISKTVTIRGGYTTAFTGPPDPEANLTTLNAQGEGRVLVVTGYISPTIEGLRITGGDADGLGGYFSSLDAGGGMYVRGGMARINNNWVYKNIANRGGGLCVYFSDATLSGNTVISNTAVNSGGGLFLSYSDATLSGNDVISNTTAWDGGGLYLRYSDATLNGNTVISNTAGRWGGGLYLDRSDATLSVNTVVADNQADTAGSGLYVERASPRLLHTTIARNSSGDGSGVYVTDDGFGNYSTVALTNTILVSHSVGITVTAGNTVTLESTLWHGNTTADWGGAGAINRNNDYTGAPLFDADGYHLLEGSAAIDKGVDADVDTDIDGDSRPQGSAPDLGADELAGIGTDVYLPIILKSASP